MPAILTTTQVAQRAYESARLASHYDFLAWGSLTSDQQDDIIALVNDASAASGLGSNLQLRHARFSGWANWSYPPMTQNSKGGADELKFLAALYGTIDALTALLEADMLQALDATLLMDGTEQDIYDVAAAVEFGGGILIIPTSAAATFVLKVYELEADGETYTDITPDNVTAAPNSYVIFGTHESAETDGTYCYVPRVHPYGLKISLEQDAEGAGYVTAAFELFDSVGP